MTNANPVDVQGVGTILDDEPRMAIGDASLVEGNSGTTFMVFPVTLTKAAGPGNITVNYNTVPGSGTATEGVDYQSVANVLTFFPGDNSRTISVPVLGDVLNEADETFTLFLSTPNGAFLTDNQATGHDRQRRSAAGDLHYRRLPGRRRLGPGELLLLRDPGCRQRAAGHGELRHGQRRAGATGATAGSDYQSRSGVLTFQPGETSLSISVPVVGDPNVEQNETFFVNLSSPVNAAFGDNQGVGTIINDEPTITHRRRHRPGAGRGHR